MDTISSVHLSVTSKFPFDSIWAKDRNYQLNVKLMRGREDHVEGLVEMEGQASCSSLSGNGQVENEVNSSTLVKERRFDIKGKGIINQRPRTSLRRRRKSVSEYGKVSSVSSHDPLCGGVARMPFSVIDHEGCEVNEQSSGPVASGLDANVRHYDGYPITSNDEQRASHCLELRERESHGAYDSSGKNVSSFNDIKCKAEKELGFDGDKENEIRILEQALKEERAVRSALYLELEKERNAAATAADEAMAMILRLQEEKASIEMEARQYQRIIEEKSAYDEEEMNILKEILVRRETEKHFLEKEVEAYRQMIYDENQQLQDDMHDNGGQFASPFDLRDPVLIIQQLDGSADKMEIVKDKNSINEVTSMDEKNHSLTVGKQHVSGLLKDADFSEQGDLDKQFSHISSSLHDQDLCEKTINLSDEEEERNNYTNQHGGMTIKAIQTDNVSDKNIPYGGENLVCQGSKDSANMILDVESQVHDVHVIDGKCNFCSEIEEWESLSENNISSVLRTNALPLKDSEVHNIDVRTSCTSTSGMNPMLDISRSSSDTTAMLPPLGASKGAKSVLSDQRRNSMPAIDNERLKIDSEVGWLRERLKTVQEERQKLGFSMEHQLQLLDDSACQFQEIWQLREPRKAARQASLPLPSPKVTSRKRRCRSVSSGVDKSL
ncbi:hypothetical protein NMG60_11017398 [Bertholletia excelsa]